MNWSVFILILNFCIIYGKNSDNTEFNNFFNENDLSVKYFSYVKNNLINYKNHSNNSDDLCLNQIQEVGAAILNQESWALEIIDSWGKIPFGILWAHLMNLGNFDECLNATRPITKDINQELNGQYCSAKFSMNKILSMIPKDVRTLKLPHDMPMQVRDVGNNALNGFPIMITVGVCFPASCDYKFLDKMFKDFLKSIIEIEFKENEFIFDPTSCARKEKINFRPVDIVTIALFSIVGALMLVSSIYDLICSHLEKKPRDLFIAFSVITNSRKIFAISTKKSENIVSSINGIRCLSILWVILGHRYAVTAGAPLINLIQVKDWYSTPFSLIITNASVSVDSFFFLSGFLIAWIGFKELDQSKGKLNIPMMYFHRYIRLTPALGVLILIIVGIFKYVGDGPMWSFFVSQFTIQCEDGWWKNLLYVQNYVNPERMCLLHTWYLAVDTQLYLISPIFLLCTYKWGAKFLYPVSTILSLASIGYVFGMFMEKNYQMIKIQQDSENEKDRNTLLYVATYARISPWLVGLCLAYFMYINKGKKMFLSKYVVVVGWLVSVTVILTIVFGNYARYQPGQKATVLEGAFYESLSRVSWSLGLAWIVYSCHNGYGGIINSFLSHPFWQVLGRLTYSMYLFHIVTLIFHAGIVRTDMHFSNYEIHMLFWGDLGMTIFISIISVLAFESPIIGLEKALLGNKNPNKKINMKDSISQEPICSVNNLYESKTRL